MRSYLNCPSCGRFIDLEQVEASCQRCGADMCTRCMHTCSKCGKEVCRDCWGGSNMCVICNHSTGFFDGVSKVRRWDSDGEGIIGIGKAIYDGTMVVHKKEKLREQSRARANEREEAKRRLLAQQRKLLKE